MNELKLRKAPKWYNKDEMYNHLRNERYSHEIAEELSERWAKDLQLSFEKGWGKASREINRDLQSEITKLREALKTIIASKGNYNYDQQVDANKVINSNISTAKQALNSNK